MNNVIDIEDSTLETRNKKGGGSYQVQPCYVHVSDRSGNPERYPRKAVLFPPRDNDGNPIPYKPGKYHLAPQSLQVAGNGFLELSFPQLIPISGK